MLEYLKLTGVGPAPTLELNLAAQLNFITGDNSLGKTLVPRRDENPMPSEMRRCWDDHPRMSSARD